MRRAVLASTTLLCLVSPALADDKPSVDLVAAFALGIVAGSSVGVFGTSDAAMASEPTPGNFVGQPATGESFAFDVSEASKCVFDIKFSQSGSFVAAIEIDANKLSSVTYEKVAEHSPTIDYKINLVGGEGVVQTLGPNGERAPTNSNSTLTTSLTADEMQSAVASFQSTYCPAA